MRYIERISNRDWLLVQENMKIRYNIFQASLDEFAIIYQKNVMNFAIYT